MEVVKGDTRSSDYSSYGHGKERGNDFRTYQGLGGFCKQGRALVGILDHFGHGLSVHPAGH